MIVVLHHAVGVEPVTGFALPLRCQPGPHVHARGVEPDEERFARLVRLLHELDRGVGELLVDHFHALAGEGARVLNLAIGV